MEREKQRGGLSHIEISIKANMNTFKIMGDLKRYRQCRFVFQAYNNGEIKNLDDYDQKWSEALEIVE